MSGAYAAIGASAATAAAAAMQATKASGVIVHVEPDEILKIVNRQPGSLVVRTSFGIFSTHYAYVVSYKGLAFYASGPDALTFPADTEIVDAKSIWVPS
jgi:hypothetical protein